MALPSLLGSKQLLLGKSQSWRILLAEEKQAGHQYK
jgi:hypothetical protein